jgi:hypothetical protein
MLLYYDNDPEHVEGILSQEFHYYRYALVGDMCDLYG